MVRDEVTISVFEGNDPLIALHVDAEDAAGAITSYDFTGVDEVEFLIKTGVAAPDADPIALYTLSNEKVLLGVPPTNGNLTVQIDGTDTQDIPGSFRYRVDVTKNGKKETVMLGPFLVLNV